VESVRNERQDTTLEFQIEELEARLAPSGGETVMPLGSPVSITTTDTANFGG